MSRWIENLIQYQKNGTPGKCPFCKGEISVNKTNFGRESIDFKCRECGKIEHFDGTTNISE